MLIHIKCNWTKRYENIDPTQEQLQAVMAALHQFYEDCNIPPARKAHCLYELKCFKCSTLPSFSERNKFGKQHGIPWMRRTFMFSSTEAFGLGLNLDTVIDYIREVHDLASEGTSSFYIDLKRLEHGPLAVLEERLDDILWYRRLRLPYRSQNRELQS